MTDRYKSAIDELYRISPSFQSVGKSGYNPGLQNMEELDTLLGHPHRSFRSVHIAGTNGKGSTAHIIASILAAAGYRTGLYTSPHLMDFRERIKVVEPSDVLSSPSFHMIEEEAVLDFLSRAGDFIHEKKPSFFEITTAMAFDFFRKEQVDFAVVECGLGGRLDSTNIISPVMSVITSIGFDHKDILGYTVQAITSEKSGIIKTGIPVVYGRMSQAAREVISKTASDRNAPQSYAPDFTNKYVSDAARAIAGLNPASMDLKSDVQALNLQTVARSVDLLAENGIIKLPEDSVIIVEAVRHTALRTGLRGRWETLSTAPRIICDIGHNENALSPVMAQLKELHSSLKPDHFYMIYGMAADKDIYSVIHLLPENATYIFTNAKGSRAMPAGHLKEIVTSGWKGERNDIVSDSVEDAVSIFRKLASPDDLLYIGGSSYVVAEAIPLIENTGG